MKQYEYMFFRIISAAPHEIKELNELAKKGWRVVPCDLMPISSGLLLKHKIPDKNQEAV